MELLQHIDPSHLPYVALACALLCGAAIIIGLLLQAVSSVFEVLFGLVEVLMEIFQGGPVAWCGCVFAIFGLFAAAGLIYLLLNAPASCAAQPTNFCRWFGFLP